MRFANQNLIFFFLLIFLAVCAFFFWAQNSRRKALENFAQKDLLEELLKQFSLRKQHLKTILDLAAVFFILIGLLRPQWGFVWQEVKRKGIDIYVALDTSKSMLSEDVKPSRLGRAKLALQDFASSLKGDRIGLIAFAGSAFIQCPLTVDYGGFLLSLEDVDQDTIPRQGTNISSAISEAIRGFSKSTQKQKSLIIISDGENFEGDPEKSAQEAKNKGIVIHCIGVGTREGELVVSEEGDQKNYLRDKAGNVVKSRLNQEMLQKIALSTGGTYVHAGNTDFGLEIIYREKLSKLEKQEFESKMNKRYTERFQWPLVLAVVLLIAESMISDKRR